MKKPKYRIVERDGSFYIQKKLLWFNCWYDLTSEECDLHGAVIVSSISFSKYKKALRYLEKTILNRVTDQVLSYH
jgi:hypothetical protein